MTWNFLAVKRSMRVTCTSRGETNENCDTGSTTATGTADTVHVVFGELGQVEVDHVGDARHVEAARGNVGGNQHANTCHGAC